MPTNKSLNHVNSDPRSPMKTNQLERWYKDLCPSPAASLVSDRGQTSLAIVDRGTTNHKSRVNLSLLNISYMAIFAPRIT